MKSIYAKKLRNLTAVGLVIIFVLSAVGIKLYIDKTRLSDELSQINSSASALAEKAKGGKARSQREIDELESRLGELEKEREEDKRKLQELESENDKLKEMKKAREEQKKAEEESAAEKNDAAKPSADPQPRVPDGGSSGKTVYLTFDDGPSKNTPQVLEVLRKYGVKGTFFVIDGKGYNKYMKDIVNEGHAIGLHSETHDYKKIYTSLGAYMKDLSDISRIVREETGVDSRIIRFPGGSSNTVSRKYCKGIISKAADKVHSMGYEYFDWNCDSGDAAGNNVPVAKLVENVKMSNPGTSRVVVLMHDAGSKSTTPQALPQIIEYFKSKGYSFGVLTEKVTPVHHKIAN